MRDEAAGIDTALAPSRPWPSHPLVLWIDAVCLVGLGIAGTLFLTAVLGASRGFAPVMVAAVWLATIRDGLWPGVLSGVLMALAFDGIWIGRGQIGSDPVATATALATFTFTVAVAQWALQRHVPLARRRSHQPVGLPFVRGRSHWAVTETGDWVTDAHNGEVHAAALVAELRAGAGGETLAWAIRDMIARGRYSGIEAGFASALARELAGRSVEHHPDHDEAA